MMCASHTRTRTHAHTHAHMGRRCGGMSQAAMTPEEREAAKKKRKVRPHLSTTHERIAAGALGNARARAAASSLGPHTASGW